MIPIKYLDRTKALMKALLNKNGIFKCTSHTLSPAFIIARRNSDDLRLVVDYRELNKAIIKTPFPKIIDYLSILNGTCVFSKIDLHSGYYQIQLDDADIKKTAFYLMNQVYGFNRMPFLLANAPRASQKCMVDMLGHLDFIKIYIDDILIHSPDYEKYIFTLEQVFNILKENRAKINFKKSNFCTQSVIYLGHRSSNLGIRSDISRIFVFETPQIKT